jgi:fructose transport system permease protein
MTTTTDTPGGGRFSSVVARGAGNAFARPTTGPLIALILAVAVFAILSDNFLTTANVSLMLRQAVVVGTLALGQTLIILTAGIDLSNGAIAVLGTIVAASLAVDGNPVLALIVAAIACVVISSLNGLISVGLKLPVFIVTLGMLAIVQASTRLYSESKTVPITSPLLTWLGQSVGGITIGSIVFLATAAVLWYVLAYTGWGRHIYAVGDNPVAARLNGINASRTLVSVYVIAGLLYALAAWQAMGRIPSADANAYQTSNLDSITAVVIGGTSLFGGRGGVVGTVIGTLIVVCLRSGLTQIGVNALYQDLMTGVLVILAVFIDQLIRRKQR